jgi:hypothetical protein
MQRGATPTRGGGGSSDYSSVAQQHQGDTVTHTAATTSAVVMDYQDRLRVAERDLASRDREIAILSSRCRAAETDAAMLGAEVRRLRNRLIALSASTGGASLPGSSTIAIEAEESPSGQLELLQRKIRESMNMVRIMHEEFDGPDPAAAAR